jgi:hypothetical protein
MDWYWATWYLEMDYENPMKGFMAVKVEATWRSKQKMTMWQRNLKILMHRDTTGSKLSQEKCTEQ